MKLLNAGFILIMLLWSGCGSVTDQLTTFILIRHAEKANDGTDDPDLTDAGKARAEKLAAMFQDTPLWAIYSTDYKRTRQTVAPLAAARNMRVELYKALEPEVVESMLEKHRGGIVLVSGHSDTTPWTANLLIGKEAYKDYPESEYGVVLMVSVADPGRIASVVRINY